MKHFGKFSLALLLLCLRTFLAREAWAQVPQIQGMGASHRASTRDTVVVEGDSLYVIVSYVAGPEWDVAGVGLNRDTLQQFRIFFHPDSVPIRSPMGNVILNVDPATLVIDPFSVPQTIRFRSRLIGVHNPLVKSLQLEMAIYAPDTQGQTFLSSPRTSYLSVGGITPVTNSVDTLHARYLKFVDDRTYPPHIIHPVPGETIPRHFPFVYNLPEDADSGTIFLRILNIDPESEELPHTLFLKNVKAAEAETLRLDGMNLFDTTVVDTLFGGAQLTEEALYEFLLSYQDINRNPAARDSILPVQVDLATQAPSLYEPHLGSSSADSTLRVLYNLPEQADTVWLTFTAIVDTVDTSSHTDPFSPHILRLAPSLNGPGLVDFNLDGLDIGTNNSHVAGSNHGALDRLQTSCLYRVTLAYGDTLGNDNATMSNDGYVWPRDILTVPPVLIWPLPEPHPSMAFSGNIHVDAYLPETPMAGSVRLRLTCLNPALDPGSPHDVFLHARAQGHINFTLLLMNLDFSDLVDSVTGHGLPAQNNTVVDSLRYLIKIVYRDSLGNPEGSSDPSPIWVDNHTRPPQILEPGNNDTLFATGVTVRYNQPEWSLHGSLRIVFTRTGGDPDTESPHTLYLSNDSSALGKTVLVQPASLSVSTGVERIEGGTALLSRAVYQMQILYSDTLGNPAAHDEINGLTVPTGSAVFATGHPLGTGHVIPGSLRTLMYRLNLKTYNGASVLRKLRFSVLGNLTPSTDVWPPQVKLFASVDTIFSEAEDSLIDHLDIPWLGGEVVFDSFTVALDQGGTNFFVSVYFPDAADPSHTMFMYIAGPGSIDCGGDPVIGDHWPMGAPDVPLSVNVTSFSTAQDTLFGALHVLWTVASETENAGFILSRKAAAEDSFAIVANWRDHPELAGQGTSPTAMHYNYLDRGLTPGRTYTYRLAYESINFDRVVVDLETQGTPRVPPTNFVLGDAYPNPFNQIVTFGYIVPYTENVEIRIYDILGRQVKELVNGHLAPAEYHANWDSRNDQGVSVPSGVYFVRLKAGTNYLKAKTLMLLK